LTNFLTARSARLDHFSTSTSSEHLRQAAHIPDPLLKRGSPLNSKFSHWYPLNAGEVLQKVAGVTALGNSVGVEGATVVVRHSFSLEIGGEADGG
jgi:hypothetical protein